MSLLRLKIGRFFRSVLTYIDKMIILEATYPYHSQPGNGFKFPLYVAKMDHALSSHV